VGASTSQNIRKLEILLFLTHHLPRIRCIYIIVINFRWKLKETCIKTTHSSFFDPCYACYMVRDCLLNPFCFIINAFHVNLYILVSFRRSSGISPWAVPSETKTFKVFLLCFLMPISITIINHVQNRNLTDFVCLMLILNFTVSSSTKCTSTPNAVSRDCGIFKGSVFCSNISSTNYANNRY
jgi:hypothetical protein